MSNNLVADQKTNWVESETVTPVHMNTIGRGINNLVDMLPVYASNGSFYENTNFSSSTYILEPVEFADESQNVAPTSYINGMEVVFKSQFSNTGDSYVNVNGLGAKQIKTLKNQALTAGTIPNGWLVTLRYDSAQNCFFILENKGSVGRNIGDLFYTYRLDDSLNGAFDANGQEFNKNDFVGDTNPYELCTANSLPSMSYEDYQQQITQNGYCSYFGIDTVNEKFKVPTLPEKMVLANMSDQPKYIKLRPMVQLATGADESSLANTTQCLAELPKKANIIWYANREFEYKQPNFIDADKQYVTIKGGTAVRLKNGQTFYTENDLLKPISEILDTGSVQNGKDYYFYLNNQGQLIASLNENAPVSGNTTNTVQIGGAHTLCVGVTSANAPTLLADSFWANHPAAGYNAGYFIPNSSWTPAFRSAALTGNKGQAFVGRGNVRIWVDIYLQSGTDSSTASSYAGTITNNRQYQSFFGDMDQVGKMLASYDEFRIFSEGSNQKTAIQGSAIPSDKKCGGYLDTAGKRMISGYFIECCCGYLWQVSRNVSATGSSNWGSYTDARRGDHYGTPYVVELGGHYGDSAHCGSWCTASDGSLTASHVYAGCRGVSLHLERIHA